MELLKLIGFSSIACIAMSLGNCFCMSRKGGTGGGGLVHSERKQHGHVWAGCENLSVGPFTYFKCSGDLENSHFTL